MRDAPSESLGDVVGSTNQFMVTKELLAEVHEADPTIVSMDDLKIRLKTLGFTVTQKTRGGAFFAEAPLQPPLNPLDEIAT